MSVPESVITLVDMSDDIILACIAMLAGAKHFQRRAFELSVDRACEVLRLTSVCLTFNRLALSVVRPEVLLEAAKCKLQACILPMLENVPIRHWTIEEAESDSVTKMDIVRFLLAHEDADFLELGPYKLHGGVDAIAKRITRKRLGKAQLIDAYKAHGERVAQRVAPAALLENLARRGFLWSAFAPLLTPGLLFSILRDCQQRVTAVTSPVVTVRIKTRVGSFRHQLHCFQDVAMRMDRSLTRAQVQRALLDHVFHFCDSLGWPGGLFAAIVAQLASDELLREDLGEDSCGYEGWREAMITESNPLIAYSTHGRGRLWLEVPGNAEKARQATLRKLERVWGEVPMSLFLPYPYPIYWLDAV